MARSRSSRPLALATALLLGLAACGEDSTEPAGVEGGAPAPAPTSDPASAPATDAEADPGTGSDPTPPPGDTVETADDGRGVAHPTGADDVVLRYEVGGGFTTREAAFQVLPRLLVSGDGRAFTVGPQTAIYPGPLLPNVQVRTIDEGGIQQLLAAADEAGLLADVTYEDPSDIADAPTTTLTIRADGETWEHVAYALALDGGLEPAAGESSPDRQRLADFLTTISDLTSVVDPDQLGEEAAFTPEEYLVTAGAVDDLGAFGSDGIEPRVVDWPDGVGTGPDEIGDCARVTADELGDLFAEADQLTFFSDGGTVYQVTPTPALPGASCPP
jgi:hypothetical protein